MSLRPEAKDFALKFRFALEALNWSRTRCAHELGLNKSVVSRWASGGSGPTEHNLTRFTAAIQLVYPNFQASAWRLDAETFSTVFQHGKAESAGARSPGLTAAADIMIPAPLIRPSIAVLPFENMNGDADQDYFVDGLTEDIIVALARWRWFLVIARNSSFRYRGRSVDPRQAGRDLGVGYVLVGSVRKAGARLRVTAQLIDAATGMHVWAERYERALTDVFAVQDELTQSVTAAIEPALARTESDRMARSVPRDMTAWDLYLRGLWHFHRVNADNAARALALFRAAALRDPGMADAHAGAARVLFGHLAYRYRSDRMEVLREASEAAGKALAADPVNPTAHFVLALIAAHDGDPHEAVRLARRALDLNTNFAAGYFALAIGLCFAGKPAEAVEAVDMALRLSPADPQTFAWHAQRASALYLQGRWQDAIDAAGTCLNLRWFHTACRVRAAALARAGRIAEAREAINALLASDAAEKTIADVIRPFLRPEDKALYAEGLRLAGMPEE